MDNGKINNLARRMARREVRRKWSKLVACHPQTLLPSHPIPSFLPSSLSLLFPFRVITQNFQKRTSTSFFPSPLIVPTPFSPYFFSFTLRYLEKRNPAFRLYLLRGGGGGGGKFFILLSALLHFFPPFPSSSPLLFLLRNLLASCSTFPL